MIYFIGCEAANAVKIGRTSGRLFERLNQAQVTCPFPLLLLASHDGGAGEEAALHTQFDADRIRGEWFSITEPLFLYMQDFPPPPKPTRGWHGHKINCAAKRAA